MISPGEEFDLRDIEQRMDMDDEYDVSMHDKEEDETRSNGAAHSNDQLSQTTQILIGNKRVTAKRVLKCLIALNRERWGIVEKFVEIAGTPVQQTSLIEYLRYTGDDAKPEIATVLDQILRGSYGAEGVTGEIEDRDQRLAEDL